MLIFLGIKNQFIYFPKEPSKILFFLKSGRIKIGTYSDEGKEIIKTVLNSANYLKHPVKSPLN